MVPKKPSEQVNGSMGVEDSLLAGSLRPAIFREEYMLTVQREGSQEGKREVPRGFVAQPLASWGRGWWLVVLGSVTVPLPHPFFLYSAANTEGLWYRKGVV